MDKNRAQIIKDVQSWPRRAGKAELLKHLRGDRLTRGEAIKAKCYECVGAEDVSPCIVTRCPLTQFCQFNREGGGDAEPEFES